MTLYRFDSEEAWLDARKGKFTGTRVGSLVSKKDGKPLKEFYQTIAERIAVPADGENAMFRGKRLEEEAMERFEKETGKKVNKDLVLVSREDDADIAYSPDGLIGKTEDVEVKCLNSASHIEALLTKEMPNEYRSQMIQGFVVNDKLKKRYMVFYDPRMPKDFFYFTIERKDVKEEIEAMLKQERELLAQIRQIETELTF